MFYIAQSPYHIDGSFYLSLPRGKHLHILIHVLDLDKSAQIAADARLVGFLHGDSGVVGCERTAERAEADELS